MARSSGRNREPPLLCRAIVPQLGRTLLGALRLRVGIGNWPCRNWSAFLGATCLCPCEPAVRGSEVEPDDDLPLTSVQLFEIHLVLQA